MAEGIEEDYCCQPCGMSFSGPIALDQHLLSQTHARNTDPNATRDGTNTDSQQQDEPTEYPMFCKICNKSFTGQQPAKTHFTSQSHRKKEQVLFTITTMPPNITCNRICPVCMVECTSNEVLQNHFTTNKHLENVYRKSLMAKSNAPVHSKLDAGVTFIMTDILNRIGDLPFSKMQQFGFSLEFGGSRLGLASYCHVCDCKIQGWDHYLEEGHKLNANKEKPDENLSSMLQRGVQAMTEFKEKVAEKYGQGYHTLPKTLPEQKLTVPLFAKESSGNTAIPESFFGTPDTARYCKLCNVRFMCYENARQHYIGKAHTKAVQKADPSLFNTAVVRSANEDPYYCKLCKCTFTGPDQAKQHYAGKIHQKSLSDKGVTLSVEDLPPPKIDLQDLKELLQELPSFCNLCSIPLSGILNAEQHYNGRTHKKALAKVGCLREHLPDDFRLQYGITKERPGDEVLEERVDFCQVCRITHTNTPNARLHYNGKQHKKKLSSFGIDRATLPPELLIDNIIAANMEDGELPEERRKFGSAGKQGKAQWRGRGGGGWKSGHYSAPPSRQMYGGNSYTEFVPGETVEPCDTLQIIPPKNSQQEPEMNVQSAFPPSARYGSAFFPAAGGSETEAAYGEIPPLMSTEFAGPASHDTSHGDSVMWVSAAEYQEQYKRRWPGYEAEGQSTKFPRF